jgi:hypothetical protein
MLTFELIGKLKSYRSVNMLTPMLTIVTPMLTIVTPMLTI